MPRLSSGISILASLLQVGTPSSDSPDTASRVLRVQCPPGGPVLVLRRTPKSGVAGSLGSSKGTSSSIDSAGSTSSRLARRQRHLFPANGGVNISPPERRRQTVTLTVEEQQGVVSGGLEMTVVGAAVLLAVYRDLGTIHIQYDRLARIDRRGPPDQLAVGCGQPIEIRFIGRQLGLKRLQPRSQSCTSLLGLLRSNQAETGSVCRLFGVDRRSASVASEPL